MNRDSLYRVLRTLVQFVAGGGLALLTNQLVQDLSAAYVPYLTIGYTILVCLCQRRPGPPRPAAGWRSTH